MPDTTLTPLEYKLMEMKCESADVTCDRTILAVGSDSAASGNREPNNSLLRGVNALTRTVADGTRHIPNTLSWHRTLLREQAEQEFTRARQEQSPESTPSSAAMAAASPDLIAAASATRASQVASFAAATVASASPRAPTAASAVAASTTTGNEEADGIDRAFLEMNRQWINSELAQMRAMSGQTVCYVFHSRIAALLKRMQNANGPVNADAFWDHSNQRYTAMEVRQMLGAGYTIVDQDPQILLPHVVLRRAAVGAPIESSCQASAASNKPAPYIPPHRRGGDSGKPSQGGWRK